LNNSLNFKYYLQKVEERLPQATRFPQRAKSAAAVASNENIEAPQQGGKKHHPKRPSLELVDSHIFGTDDKVSQKGPRIIENEHSKSESYESVSKSSIEYASSTFEPSQDLDEDTTPLMEKVAFDLYAHSANENAKEEDKKSNGDDIVDATTIENDEFTTLQVETTQIPVTVTTTTTEKTTTVKTTTTTTELPTTTTEAPQKNNRNPLSTAGRNRFRFQGKGSTTEKAVESTEAPKSIKNRFQKPSTSYRSNSASRASKPTAAPVNEENVEKSEAPQSQSSSAANRFKPGNSRNRFNLRNNAASTDKAIESDIESTTASRLIKPRPQFSLRNRSRAGESTTVASSTIANENNAEENEQDGEKPVEKSSSPSSIVARPTSRLNINRPGNRILPSSSVNTAAAAGAGPKVRTNPLTRSRVNSNAQSNNGSGDDNNKSTNENESETEGTTQSNVNKLKSRPRIQISADAKAKKTAAQPVINRKVNPLISKRKFGVTSTTGKLLFQLF
jgi:hypothetical protein